MAAAAVALGVGEVAGLLFAPRASPLVAVGGVVIDVVPESGKELAIRLFGIYDKIALQVGTVVILLAIAGLVGVLSLRRLLIGMASLAAYGRVLICAPLSCA